MAKQCIERCLTTGLGSVIFTTNDLMDMSDDKIHELAKELPDIIRTRSHLAKELKRLEDGAERFKIVLGQCND